MVISFDSRVPACALENVVFFTRHRCPLILFRNRKYMYRNIRMFTRFSTILYGFVHMHYLIYIHPLSHTHTYTHTYIQTNIHPPIALEHTNTCGICMQLTHASAYTNTHVYKCTHTLTCQDGRRTRLSVCAHDLPSTARQILQYCSLWRVCVCVREKECLCGRRRKTMQEKYVIHERKNTCGCVTGDDVGVTCNNTRNTGWRRPIGCLISWIIFIERATNYRALWRKMTFKDKAS